MEQQPEPHVGLTALLAAQAIHWRDIIEYVEDVQAVGAPLFRRSGLGQRLGEAAAFGAALVAAVHVALVLARAYNGMLDRHGHLVDLGRNDLPMKRLTMCTALDPGLLPTIPAIQGERSWAAQIPQARYPTLMCGDRLISERPRRTTPLTIRMWRFACYLARGPPPEVAEGETELEVCHACSNTWCVRPSHLRWDSHSRNMQERRPRKRRK